MAYLRYRSGLVPRFIPVLGLIGDRLVFVSNTAVMFGTNEQLSAWAALAAVFAWELTLAGRRIVKGVNASAIAVASPNTAARELLRAA